MSDFISFFLPSFILYYFVCFLASCKFYYYQLEIDIIDGLNNYRCSYVSGMSKGFFFFFAETTKEY